MTSRALIVGTAAVATVLAGCGQPAEEQAQLAPVVVAEPVPLEGTGLAPSPVPTPGPTQDAGGAAAAGPSQAPTPPADPAGPSSADAAAFVAGDAFADLNGLEHVVVDLDGDSWSEVVAAGVRERVGAIRVAWWTADGYRVLADGAAGPGNSVTDLRAADVNDDGVTELLVAVEGEGLRSLSVWAVPRRGQVEPLPVADWSEHRWRWEDGAYRHEQQFPPGPPDHASRPDDAGRAGGDGGGSGSVGGGGSGSGDGSQRDD